MLSLITPPTEEPILLPDTKVHARIEVDEDDALIEGFILAAISNAEWFTQRAFVTQEWELRVDRFPVTSPIYDDFIELPKPPFQEITSISYLDAAGAEVVLDPADYRVIAPSGPFAGRAKLFRPSGLAWPTVRAPYGLTIRWLAGYGDGKDVPEQIKTALRMWVAELYENRENTITLTGQGLQEVPFSVATTLWPFKVDKHGI